MLRIDALMEEFGWRENTVYLYKSGRIDFTHGIASSTITSPATDGRKEIEIEIETSFLAKRWARNEAWDGKLI